MIASETPPVVVPNGSRAEAGPGPAAPPPRTRDSPVPTLRVGTWSVAFPALPEVMPLLYFGILTLLVALILAFTQVSLSIGRLPFWWYLLGLGVIAVLGALAAAHADDDEFHEGDRVGENLVAVRADEWEAWQTTQDLAPDWVEGEPRARLDPLVELESLHEELDQARRPAPEAATLTGPTAAPVVPARQSPLGPSTAMDGANPPGGLPGVEEISSRVPPVTSSSGDKTIPAEVASLSALTAAGSGTVGRHPPGRPRCAHCDRDSVPMDPGFRCSSCGRGLCLDCAPQFPQGTGPMRCPVCRTFEDFGGPKRNGAGGPTKGPNASMPRAG